MRAPHTFIFKGTLCQPDQSFEPIFGPLEAHNIILPSVGHRLYGYVINASIVDEWETNNTAQLAVCHRHFVPPTFHTTVITW